MNIKSYVLHRIVPLSMALSDPETQFQGHHIVQRRISRKRCILSTPYLVLVQVFRGRRIEWRYISGLIKSKMAAEFCIFFVYLDIQKWPQIRNWFAD